MGYAEDQFFQIPGSDALVDQVLGTTNPPFLFPGGTRKVLSTSGKMVDKTVQRGFIRMLADSFNNDLLTDTSAVATMGAKRLFFQFNPATLSNSVQMRSDVYSPMLQDPSQFTLPIPGNSTFYFSLQFDRQKEINRRGQISQTPGSVPVVDQEAGPGGTSLTPNNDTTTQNFGDLLAGADPRDVGVLADIRMLGEIVGMGITQDMVNFVLAQGEVYNSYQSSEETEPTEFDSSSAGTFLGSNFGNQAFLFPNPIRIVFSSLYQVDGFITSIAITHAKFNEAMVPVTCGVDIGVDVRYLGFAKAETFLTQSLESAAPQVITPTPSVPLTPPPSTTPLAQSFEEIKEKLQRLTVGISNHYVKQNGLSVNISWPYYPSYEDFSFKLDETSFDTLLPTLTNVDTDVGSGSNLSTVGSISYDHIDETGSHLHHIGIQTDPYCLFVVAFPDIGDEEHGGYDHIVTKLFDSGELLELSVSFDIEVVRKSTGSSIEKTRYETAGLSSSRFSGWPEDFYVPFLQVKSGVVVNSPDRWRQWLNRPDKGAIAVVPFVFDNVVQNRYHYTVHPSHAGRTLAESQHMFLEPAFRSTETHAPFCIKGEAKIRLTGVNNTGYVLTTNAVSGYYRTNRPSGLPAGNVYMTAEDRSSFDFYDFKES